MTSFQLSFDYRCPFAKNIHLHVITALKGGADYEVRFVPWTLGQGHRHEGAPDVWDDTEKDADHLSMCVGVSLRDQQPERFLDAHAALFLARHEGGRRLVTMEEIEDVLAPLGVDMEMVRADVLSRRPHQVIRDSYQEFARFEAFGVPTFVVGDDAIFVRYMTTPSDDAKASMRVIDSILNLIELEPELNEFKHTQISR